MRNCYNLLFLLMAGNLLYSCNSGTATTGAKKNTGTEIMEDAIIHEAEYLLPEQYVKWVTNETNGLKKTKQVDDLVFSIQYKPHEYIACLENYDKQLTDSVLKKTVEELSEMQYYELKIEKEKGQGELLKQGITSPAEYNQRVNYFSFEMQKDIQLVEGADTISCGLYHFERAYDVAPFSKILLGFSLTKNNSSKEKTLLVYDRTFNKGLLKFTFSNKALINIPKLKTL